MGDTRRCKAATRAGKRCKRRVQAGSDFCSLPQHGGSGGSVGAPAGNVSARRHGFYAGLYTEIEVEHLATAAAAGGDLTDEIALLRVRIHRALEEGADLDTVGRALGRLTQMLKAQKVLSGEAVDEFAQAMSDVLEGLAEELGLSLV